MAITRSEAAHLLRRTGFGVSDGLLQPLLDLGNRAEAVEHVLAVQNSPATPPVRDADGVFLEWWKVTQWWLDQMRTSTSPIVEKMTLFWHNHFVSSASKVPSMELLMGQHQTFRQHALGDFHAMVQDVAVDPAMLIYLDNWLNASIGPQENFARELLELFTVGVGRYTESDVAELARAWTGYGLDYDYRTHRHWPQWHDHGDKALFGLAPRPWNGPETITEILHGTLSVAASEFIAAKVFSSFAYPVEPGDPVIVPIAGRFRSSGLDITELLRAILTSEEFWSPSARYALVRSPIEWMVAGMQALDLKATDVVQFTDLVAAGQVPFGHPEVDGWGVNEYWATTGGAWARSQWAARARISSFYTGVFAGVEHLSPSAIATTGFERFGIVDPSPNTRAAVEAWAARSQAEGDAAIIPANLTMLMLLSPDFQLA